MPGLTARSAAKNMSRSARAKTTKNTRRVLSAVAEELGACTYGKVIKVLGNKMFFILTPEKSEHLAHVRGKMVRVAMNDVVLLNVREYESRAAGPKAVYDIMAVFAPRDASKLIKSAIIPAWMLGGESCDGDDIFEYEEKAEDEDATELSRSDSPININSI